jgi:NADPH:quinone reductase-like Zn-dependent oxidoreductase
MRALHAYAQHEPSRLVVEEAPAPTMGPTDVLVRVHASGISPGELEWNLTWLDPDNAPRTPPIVPGHEVSGLVEAVGSAAAGWSVGDAVFGLIDFRRDGGDAELVAVRADELAPKPAAATHAEVAAVPLSALTAWQALFDQGQLAAGETVLVHGGAGGVGSFAVQLARWRGARVIATSSARDRDAVHELGAEEVIDYRAQHFEDAVAGVDLVFDTVGGETWERSWEVLGPRGRLVSVAVPRPPERESGDARRAIWFIVEPDPQQLREIGGLIDAGHIRSVVSGEIPLARAAEAYGPAARRDGPGKAVLIVAGGADPDPVASSAPPRSA